jgi:hypothetical protein
VAAGEKGPPAPWQITPWPHRQNETPRGRNRSSLPPNRVKPAAFDSHVSFIDAPGFVRRLQMRSSPLLEFRCKVLNPSPDRRMVDLQASFDQQFPDITIRKRVAKVPANGTENDLGSEVPPLKDRWWVGLGHDLSSIAVRSWRFLQHIPYEEPQRFTQRLNRLLGIVEARNWRPGRAKANEYFRWAIRTHLAVSAR